MTKRLNVNVQDETHRLLRIALAEDATNFSTWLQGRIDDYLREKGKLPKGKPEKEGKQHGAR